ncbi:MAG TPA: MFS transporter, partial [Acidimicrobiales bacterium]|nr:MFS transporter [Acidimicrobiales bacterium]
MPPRPVAGVATGEVGSSRAGGAAPGQSSPNGATAAGYLSPDDRYRWTALIISTLGMFMATIDGSIVLIALPDIFRGIGIDPLQPGNSFYLLWMILGFLVVTSALVVTLGRLGDMYGRARIYNLGFAVFTLFSLLLSITWMTGPAAGMWLITMRIFQGVGAAMLMANSAAILTDAFPANKRGMALGINQAAAFSGTFIGLVLGGVLAPINWRLIFLVSVPVGLLGTVWGYLKLRELGTRRAAKIDWPGNVTFALGMVLIMVGITYGIEPYGGHTMGWQNPRVLASIAFGVVLLIAFCVIETRVPEPMFRLQLFRIRAFASGVFASFLAALSRGGLMFILVIWLQGIWLPLHGFDFEQTPLWAGIAMIPLTVGLLIAAPISGVLSDRFGVRPFATGSMLGTAICFVLLQVIPVDAPYWMLGSLLFLTGLTMAAFGSPNRTGVMNALPPEHRGAGSGMNMTFQNSAQVFSIGIFFTLIIVGLSGTLRGSLYSGLVQHGVSPLVAIHASHLPPVSTLFAAFLGYNPIKHLIGPATVAHLPAVAQAT